MTGFSEDEERDRRPIWERVEDPYLNNDGELPDEERWHREKVSALLDTYKTVGVFGLIPLGLIVLFLSLFLGDWVWSLMLVFPLALFVAPILIPVIARWRSKTPMRSLDGTKLTEGQKARTLLVGTLLVLASVLIGEFGGQIGFQLREWIMKWTIPWPSQW